MTWDDVRLEISRERTDDQNRQSPHDIVRRRKIQNVEAITGRPLIIYAVSFTESDKAIRVGSGIQIELGDKTGFDQAISDIPPGQLDILLHSPGGSPAATESLVHQLRKRFDNIRFIVPHTVKSAATMFALSGNEILVGPDAEFGPIDPQLSFSLDGRTVAVPAQAAIDQFERAYEEVNGGSQENGSLASHPSSVRSVVPARMSQRDFSLVSTRNGVVGSIHVCGVPRGQEKSLEARLVASGPQ